MELIHIIAENLSSVAICLVDHIKNKLIDFSCGSLGIILSSAAHISAEEYGVVVCAVAYTAEFLSHTVLCNHCTGCFCSLFNIV